MRTVLVLVGLSWPGFQHLRRAVSPSSLGPKTFKLRGSTHDLHGLSLRAQENRFIAALATAAGK